MICPMTRIQIRTSKKPAIGARYLKPLATRISRTVPTDTSVMRARKISPGRITQEKRGVSGNNAAVTAISFF